MSPETIWYEKTYVRSNETDFLKRWRLSSFFGAMIEAAAHHAAHLGWGYHDMLARDLLWILSRVKVRFFEIPLVEEQVTVQTWPKGLQQKVFFMRDYHILGSDGRRLASATSGYVLISPRARRMQMPQALGGEIPDNGGLSALDEPLEKIPAAEPLSERMVVQASYSAVDLVGHVNNTRYIDWVSDCFSFEEYQAQRPAWLQINFLNEVRPGEAVTLYRAPYPGDPATWYVTGTNQKTGARAFEAAIGWVPCD